MNQVLWSMATVNQDTPVPGIDNLRSGQIIPEACQVANSHHITVPAWTQNKPVPIYMYILAGQNLSHSQAFFQPAPLFFEKGFLRGHTPLGPQIYDLMSFSL